MKYRRAILIGVGSLYLLGLGVGYIRLPCAAIKNLRDYRSLASDPVVTFSDNLDASPIQRWYLEHAFNESPVPVVPRLSVDVKWNALIAARVRSGYFRTGKGAENRDGLLICLFGAWVSVHTYRSEIS